MSEGKTELDVVQEHYVDAELGRTRNARIAAAAVTALVVAMLIISALSYSQFRYAREGDRRDDLSRCRADALATVIDRSFDGVDYRKGDLSRLYDACDEKFK